MVLNLGGFKFNWKQVGGISLETEFGISSQDRIQNHPVLFAANLGNQTVSIEGQTMPYNGDKQTALKRLYELARSRQSYPLTNETANISAGLRLLKSAKNKPYLPQTERFLRRVLVWS